MSYLWKLWKGVDNITSKKVFYTKQGYSYVKCTKEESFSWGGAAICDSCGSVMNDDIYLIYILASAYCPKCFEKWSNNATEYEDDIRLQNQMQNRWYKSYGFKIS